MAGNRRWQPALWAKKIDRASLAVVLAENGGAFFILGAQVMINVRDRANHLFPAKLVGEKLRQRGRMRCFGAWQLQMDAPHVCDKFVGRQNRYHQWRKERARCEYPAEQYWLQPFEAESENAFDRHASRGKEHRVRRREIITFAM